MNKNQYNKTLKKLGVGQYKERINQRSHNLYGNYNTRDMILICLVLTVIGVSFAMLVLFILNIPFIVMWLT